MGKDTRNELLARIAEELHQANKLAATANQIAWLRLHSRSFYEATGQDIGIIQNANDIESWTQYMNELATMVEKEIKTR